MTTPTKYQTYPKYKSSGIDWLGDIPEGWEVKRLKDIIEPLQSGGRESESINLDSGVLSIGGEHVGWNGEILLENPRYITREYYLQMNQGKIKENDVLLVKDGATIGKTALIDKSFSEDAAVNEHVFIIRANNKNTPKYLYYFIISKIGQEQIFLEMRGSAQPGLNSGFISKSFLFAPPKDEQKHITDFLDRETARIDEVVAKKQRLMELFKEKRQALITHAVTKGLDPKAKMKPSGIDWLGDIPEGWEIKKAKYLGRAIIGLTYHPDEVVNEDEGILILRSSNIQNGLVELNDNVYVKKEIPENLITKIGDILICSRNGSIQLIGKNILIDKSTENLSFGAFMTIFRSKYFEFLYYFFNSSLFTSQTGLFSTSTINQLTTSILDNMEIPLPPAAIQKEIVNVLKIKTAKIDEIMKKIETQIEKLQEYRQALITSAVTGKIMVN